jgi:translocation and assembly module TamB
VKRALLVVGAVLLVLTALFALAWGLVTSEPGLRWILARALDRLPPGSAIGEVRGSARGPLEIRDLRFEAGGMTVEISRATIEWTPAALLQRTVHLTRVAAHEVRIAPAAARPAGVGGGAPELSVTVLVDALSVERLDLKLARDGEPLRIDEVRLAGELDSGGITVRSLYAAGLGATAEGELTFRGSDAFSSRIDWRYAPAGFAPLAGTLQARARGGEIAVEQTVADPYDLAFTGMLDPDARRLRGRLTADGTSLDALRADWPALTIGGSADVDGSLDEVQASIEGRVAFAGAAPLDLRGQLRADRETLVVTDAHAVWGGISASGQGEASARELIAGTAVTEVPITLDLSAFELPVPQLGTVHGRGRISGTLARHDVEGEGSVATALAGDGSWKIAARGESRVLTLDALEVAVGDGTARAQGSVDWRASPELRLEARIDGADPAILWPGVPGRLRATASLDAAPAAGRWAVTVDSLSGTLRGQPASGHGGVRYESGSWRIDDVALAMGSARASVDGDFGAMAALRWSVEAPDLRAVLPAARGRLVARGSIEGPGESPRLAGEIEGSGWSGFGVDAGSLQGQWTIDLAGRTPIDVTFEATGLAAGGRPFEHLRIDGKGPLDAHSVDVTVQSGKANARLALTGGWNGRDWQGRVADFTIEAAALGRWALIEQAALTVGAQRLGLEQVCLRSAEGTSCLRAEWTEPSRWAVHATLADVPLGAFGPVLPPALEYSGRAAGELDLRGDGREITVAEAVLEFTPGAITQRDPARDLLAWQRARAEAHLRNDRVVLNAGVSLQGESALAFEASLPPVAPWQMADAPVEGSLTGVIHEVPLVAALLPDLSELEGETRLDLRVAGTVMRPAIYGTASFRNGAASLPRLGIELEDVTIELRGDGRELALEASAASGNGNIAIRGALAPAGADGWTGAATMSGRRFVAVDTPNLHAEISPNVELRIDGRNVTVSGDVSLPRARVAPRDLKGALRPSSDTVIVGERAEDARSSWNIEASMRFALGSDVQFEGFGLDAQIGGSISVVERPESVTTATGELRVIEGTYTAYGRELELDHGRLIFNGGPIDNPALDARASRRIDQQTVGVDARGSLRKPELKLFSDPELSQPAALAYLLTGRPLSGLSSGEQLELADTSQQVGLSGAGILASEVGRHIGLDEVGVENAGDQERASFFVGKYLSPKLYVSYGLGLFETFNTLRLRYAFTPQLSVQVESGTEHSADVLYTIDR